MLSWSRAAGNGSVGRLLILLLLGDGRIVQGASPETTFNQLLMQLCQRRYGHARHAKRHSGASAGIEHPGGHDDDHTRRRFEMNHLAASAPLRVLPANPPPVEGVPAVTNLNFLPDMGRMTARWLSAATTGPSPAPMPAASALPPSTR